ncbi:MAG TPA: ABC transporter permease [Methanoregulaceae archaeon]|mgnify:CR=1 FL=1|nr:ABC transporter permease [Methanoregulaceae archaeon]HQJ88322.1 ABC transporter permease [Methanoregulaceae archaeon]
MRRGSIIFQLAVRNIRLNLLRSLLAALGIVIGVIAIAAMGMMGANMTLMVKDQMSEMGNVLTVTHDAGTDGGGGPGGGPPGMSRASNDDEDDSYITESQFRAIRSAVGSNGTVYTVHSTNDRFSAGTRDGRATVYGLDPDVIPRILNLSDGAYPKGESGALVGASLAERFNLTLGSRLSLGDEDEGTHTIRVVGIVEERGMSFDLSTDMAVILPEKAYTSFYGNEEQYNQVNVILRDIDSADATSTSITERLNAKKRQVRVSDASRMLESITSTIGTMTTFVMAIAGISLLVAAVSIFNVMMMSVTERVREIGIMRSLGTQKTEILKMFLYESAVLGVTGSLIGAAGSFGIGYLVVVSLLGSADHFFEPQSLVYLPLAMLVGTAICILSGLYPSWRAAKLDPIEALRAE